MSGATVLRTNKSSLGSAEYEVRLQLNKAVADLDALQVTVAAIIVAATTSLAAVAAVTAPLTITAAKVATNHGTTT